MIRHFFTSLLLYISIILSALLILGVAKRFDDQTNTGKKRSGEMAACQAFKFDNCKEYDIVY